MGVFFHTTLFLRNFPWQENNYFQLLVNGGETFPGDSDQHSCGTVASFSRNVSAGIGLLLDQFIVSLFGVLSIHHFS